MSSEAVAMPGVVEVRGVGKFYRLYRRPGHRLLEWFGGRARHVERWALRDVSFSLGPGESVGIVGRNGAGKSTLLKIITGTTTPSVGEARTLGRVSSLLELGTGFHSDFSGAQNVLVGGRIMGLSEHEITALVPEVVEFAGIGQYIHQPVRTYSSGMQMRLGFALATAVRPDVLIIDEALSVGDIQFQQRCLDRIRGFQQAGTSLLFVSHDLATVATFCKRVIVLEDGHAVYDGEPKAGLERYYASMIRGLPGTQVASTAPSSDQEPGAGERDAFVGDDPLPQNPGDILTGACTLRSVRFFDRGGRRVMTVTHGEQLDLAVAVRFHEPCQDPHLGFKLHNKDGLVIFETVTYCLRHFVGPVGAGETVVFHFRFDAAMHPGEYTVTIGVADGGYNVSDYRRQLAYRSHCAALSVGRDGSYQWSGLFNLKPSASSDRVDRG